MKKTKSYEEIARMMLKNIKKFKPDDNRLRTTTQIIYIHNALHQSLVDWSLYLNGWLTTELNKSINLEDSNVLLSEKKLLEVYEKMKEHALDFIPYELKITKFLNREYKKVLAKQRKIPKESEHPIGMVS